MTSALSKPKQSEYVYTNDVNLCLNNELNRKNFGSTKKRCDFIGCLYKNKNSNVKIRYLDKRRKYIHKTKLSANPYLNLSVPIKKAIFKDYVGYFYKIKNLNQETIGYLCGTRHFCQGTLFHLSGPISKALIKSQKIFLEKENPVQILEEREKKIYEVLREKEGHPLLSPYEEIKKLLNDENYDHAVSKYEEEINNRENNFKWNDVKINFHFDALSPFEKLKLCRKHYEMMMARELGKLEEELKIQGLDDFLYIIAQKLGKNVYGLDNNEADLELALFNATVLNSIGPFLHPNFEKEKQWSIQMSKMWLSGQIPITSYHKTDLSSEESKLYFDMTLGRSEKIAQVIIKDLQSQQGRSFYAFGSGHLFNPRSVICSLKSRGFKVIRY